MQYYILYCIILGPDADNAAIQQIKFWGNK